MVTQMAEQLVTEGYIYERELLNMTLPQARRKIGLSIYMTGFAKTFLNGT